MKRKKVKKEKNFLVIRSYFFLNPDLSFTEKGLLAIIEYLQKAPDTFERNFCFATNETLRKQLGVAKRTIQNMLPDLKRRGYITIEYGPSNPKKRKIKITEEALNLGNIKGKQSKKTKKKQKGRHAETAPEKKVNSDFSDFESRVQKIAKTWNHCENLPTHNLNGIGLLLACCKIEDEILKEHSYSEVIKTIETFNEHCAYKKRFGIPDKGVSLKEFFSDPMSIRDSWFKRMIDPDYLK